MTEEHDPKTSDAKLIARAQQGHSEAFGKLYERYVTQIYRYLRSRVGDDRDAEDLTESVFVRSFEALEDYQERGHPYSAFLYQVARNVLVDHYRSSPEEYSLEDSGPFTASGLDPESRVVETDQAERLLEKMNELPEDYQEVIRLRILLSLPTATAAEWLDRSEGAVRVLLYRALKSLRQLAEMDRHGD